MRGEFVGVWEETHRELWTPLIDREGVSEDVFALLYRELSSALKEPTGDDALALVLNDAVQLRMAFERSLALAGVEIELAAAREAFVGSGATEQRDPVTRRRAAESALAALIGDGQNPNEALLQALYELAQDPTRLAEAKERALDETLNNAAKSRDVFVRVRGSEFQGERSLVDFLEAAFLVLEDMHGDELANRYFNLLAGFIDKYSLRYDLRRPCTLCPTLPGVFASLVRDLRVLTGQDAHLDALMKEFEEAVRDLRHDCSDGRIKTCIQKQVNLLEAIGRTAPGVTGATLGIICNQVGTWPHDKLKEAMKDLYGFASDYPGIRHGGTPANALRVVDMRDMVAMSILLVGFTPYLSNGLDADVVYRGS